MTEFKTTIGLEVHCQLKTKSKMFCGCKNDAEGAEPNTLVCPVCLAMPGTLPVANKEAIYATIKTGLALNSEIPNESKFDRKHYFYPDLPKGFQVSQFDKPFCKGGEVDVFGHAIRLNRIHLEEDAGKLTHPIGKNYSLVDLNRAGTPLMEIVSEPDIESPQEAKHYMEELQLLVRYIGVSDADMEKGHMRCDANISVQKDGKSSPIIEIKNLNSFKFVEQALSFEEKRLSADFQNWPDKIYKITRGFDSENGVTFEQRRKEEAADYRYFPEPDLPPIRISKKVVEEIRQQIPELPKAKHQRLVEKGMRPDVAEKIVKNLDFVDYLKTAEEIEHEVAIFVTEEVLHQMKNHTLSYADYKKRVPLKHISELLNFVKEGMISKTTAKEIFAEMVRTGYQAAKIIKEKGLEQVSDEDELQSVIKSILDENKDLVEKYRSGKTEVIGFFVGQVMRKTAGKANPEVVNKILLEKLK